MQRQHENIRVVVIDRVASSRGQLREAPISRLTGTDQDGEDVTTLRTRTHVQPKRTTIERMLYPILRLQVLFVDYLHRRQCCTGVRQPPVCRDDLVQDSRFLGFGDSRLGPGALTLCTYRGCRQIEADQEYSHD